MAQHRLGRLRQRPVGLDGVHRRGHDVADEYRARADRVVRSVLGPVGWRSAACGFQRRSRRPSRWSTVLPRDAQAARKWRWIRADSVCWARRVWPWSKARGQLDLHQRVAVEG